MPQPHQLTEDDKIRAAAQGLVYLMEHETPQSAYDFLKMAQPDALRQVGETTEANIAAQIIEYAKLLPELAGKQEQLRAFLLELHRLANAEAAGK